MKNLIKTLLPASVLKFIRPYYHGLVAVLGSWYFGRPSNKLIVVGVTGTAGKSTTVQILSTILNNAHKHGLQERMNTDRKCGFITTVSFFDGENEFINKHGLSMPGGWLLQKQLKQMLKNGCLYAVIECTSEGLAQNRHLGIKFDVAVLTNLSAAHIEAHGSFEKYREAKGKLFKAISKSADSPVSKTIVVNGDDENAEWFLKFPSAHKVVASFMRPHEPSKLVPDADSGLTSYKAQKTNHGFKIGDLDFAVKLPGEFNLYNALLAVVTAHRLGVSLLDAVDAISAFTKIRGRMEEVENNKGFRIFVDYGCEPVSIKAALMAASNLPHNRLIHVFGSTGGHRDKNKRFEFGKISAQIADVIIITNDDVYDSDPERIAEDILSGISKFFTSAKASEDRQFPISNIQTILDRRKAIYKALSIAKSGDIVLITGKGSEQFLVLPSNRRIAWDDVSVVREELEKI